MSEWTPVTLGTLIDIKHGYAFPGSGITSEETDDILVTPGNFEVGGGFKATKFKYFHGDYPEEYVLAEGDLIVSMTDLSRDGDTLGYSAIVPKIEKKNLLHNQRIGLVTVKADDVSTDFLHWLLRSKRYRFYVLGSATGSSVRHTSPDRIKEIELDIPTNLHEQEIIAEILSSLDEKIELNRKQNRTLEAIAQALFKRWFVEFEFPDQNGQPYKSSGGAMQPSELGEIPVGWEVYALSEVTTCLTRGLTPSYLDEGGITVLNQRCIRDGWINTEPARRHDPSVRKIIGKEL
jgi:type I restriction enzyme S subunit